MEKASIVEAKNGKDNYKYITPYVLNGVVSGVLSAAINQALTNYLPLSGGSLTGSLSFPANLWHNETTAAINMNNSDIAGLNAIWFNDTSNAQREGINFIKSGADPNSKNANDYETLRAVDGNLYFENKNIPTETKVQGSAGFTMNTTNTTQVSYFYGLRQGNMLFINGRFINKTIIGDGTLEFFTINLSAFGINSLVHTFVVPCYSDGGNAMIMAEIDSYGTFKTVDRTTNVAVGNSIDFTAVIMIAS